MRRTTPAIRDLADAWNRSIETRFARIRRLARARSAARIQAEEDRFTAEAERSETNDVIDIECWKD